MGISKLGQLIKQEAKNAIRERKFEEYNGEIVVIDISILLHSCIRGIRRNNDGDDFTTTKGKLTSHIFAIKSKIFQLLKYGIFPVFVFDGKPPELKRNTLQERRKNKQRAQERLDNNDFESNDERIKLKTRTYNITEEHIKEVQQLLTLMGIPWINAVGEAEAECASLSKAHSVYAVSEDWDLLPFNTKKMLKNFSNKKKIVMEIDLKKVEESLGLDHSQFIELCILLGTDYCPGVKGVSPVNLYKEFKRNGNMENFLDNMKQFNEESKDKQFIIQQEFLNSWREIKDIFLHTKVKNPQVIDIKWYEPQTKELIEFLEHYEFNKYTIDDEIKILVQMHNKYTFSGNILRKCTNIFDPTKEYGKSINDKRISMEIFKMNNLAKKENTSHKQSITCK